MKREEFGRTKRFADEFIEASGITHSHKYHCNDELATRLKYSLKDRPDDYIQFETDDDEATVVYNSATGAPSIPIDTLKQGALEAVIEEIAARSSIEFESLPPGRIELTATFSPGRYKTFAQSFGLVDTLVQYFRPMKQSKSKK